LLERRCWLKADWHAPHVDLNVEESSRPRYLEIAMRNMDGMAGGLSGDAKPPKTVDANARRPNIVFIMVIPNNAGLERKR